MSSSSQPETTTRTQVANQFSTLNVNQMAANLNFGGAFALIISTAAAFLVAGMWRDFFEDAIDLFIPRVDPHRSKRKQLAFNFVISVVVTLFSVLLIALVFQLAAANYRFLRRFKMSN